MEKLSAHELMNLPARINMINDWSDDVCEQDRVIAWGAGQSSLDVIRVADSDLAFCGPASIEEQELLALGDDAWIVSLSPADVHACQLDADRAVRGYRVLETR